MSSVSLPIESADPTLGEQRSNYPSVVRAWWSVAVFSFAAIVSYTDRLILSALVDPIRSSLGITDSAIGLLQGLAFVLVYVCSGLLLGRLADQKHRLTILIAGSAVWCAGTVACGLASSFWTLFIARAVVGVGEAALAPAAISIIADSFPPARRGLAVSLFMLGFFMGGPASIAVGSGMLSLANGGTFAMIPAVGSLEPWRVVLVLVGIAGVVVPASFMTLREPVRHADERALPLRVMIKRLSLERHSLVPLYLAMGLMSVGDFGMFAWMPSVLSRQFAMPPADVGQTFGMVTVAAGALGCLLGGVGSDIAVRRRGTRGRLYFCVGTAVVAGVGAALICVPFVWVTLVGLCTWMLFSGMSMISGTAALQSLVPGEYCGVGIALMAFCNILLGMGLGPTLVAGATENIYGHPVAVGFAISTVVVPAGAIAAALFAYASRGVAAK